MLLKQIKRTIKHTIIYGLGKSLSPLIALLILPIFTRYLSPQDYGIVAMVVIGSSLLSGIMGMGLMAASTRYYFEFEEKKAKDDQLMTAYSAILICSTVITGSLLIVNQVATMSIFNYPPFVLYAALGLAVSFLQTINQVPLNYLRILEKSKSYSAITMVQAFVQTALSLILIVKLEYTVLGILLPMIAGQIISGLITHIYFFRTISPRTLFNRKLIKPLLQYGLPLSILLVSNWIIDFSDRFVLEQLTNLDTVGIYNIGYSIALGITIITGAFMTAWPVISFSIMKSKNAPDIYTKCITYYSCVIAIPYLLITFLAKDVFLLFDSRFIEGAEIVPIIGFAYAIRGIYVILVGGTTVTKRTKYQLLMEIPPMMINVLLMIWWIPKFGMIGAAWSTLVAFALMPVIAYIINKKIYHIPLEAYRLLKIALTIGVFLWINIYLPVDFSIKNIAIKMFIVIFGFPCSLYVLSFYNKQELQFAKELIRKRLE
jgi:O-antigen/teichoic acid export membrane protein